MYRYGYGIPSFDATSSSLCHTGSTDIISNGPKSESFVMLNIVKDDEKLLSIKQFNQNDYSLPKEVAGFICERDGMY